MRILEKLQLYFIQETSLMRKILVVQWTKNKLSKSFKIKKLKYRLYSWLTLSIGIIKKSYINTLHEMWWQTVFQNQKFKGKRQNRSRANTDLYKNQDKGMHDLSFCKLINTYEQTHMYLRIFNRFFVVAVLHWHLNAGLHNVQNRWGMPVKITYIKLLCRVLVSKRFTTINTA